MGHRIDSNMLRYNMIWWNRVLLSILEFLKKWYRVYLSEIEWNRDSNKDYSSLFRSTLLHSSILHSTVLPLYSIVFYCNTLYNVDNDCDLP